MKQVYLTMMALLLSGCTVITFENGQVLEKAQSTEAWHHNFANGLFEGSEPVNIKTTCTASKWQSVTTSLTPQNALAAMFINSYTPGIELWKPKTVEIACAPLMPAGVSSTSED